MQQRYLMYSPNEWVLQSVPIRSTRGFRECAKCAHLIGTDATSYTEQYFRSKRADHGFYIYLCNKCFKHYSHGAKEMKQLYLFGVDTERQ